MRARRPIDIAVEDGGRALIRVSDDGTGMERDDAVLALERHATSKIRAANDLVGVRSFGFRGEALPAIARCRSSRWKRRRPTAPGRSCACRGRRAAATSRDAARRRGTTITRIAPLLQRAGAPASSSAGARSEWRGDRRSRDRASRSLGATCASRGARWQADRSRCRRARRCRVDSPRCGARRSPSGSSPVDDVQRRDSRVAGSSSGPADVGTASRRVFLTVNGRAVRDHGIVRAAEQAYRSTIPAGVRPSLCLDVVVPADIVDVNVHPAKAEVRFRDRWSRRARSGARGAPRARHVRRGRRVRAARVVRRHAR